MTNFRRALLVVSALACVLSGTHAVNARATDGVRVSRFSPRALPPAQYAFVDKSTPHEVTSADGTKIFTETWRPAPKLGGPVPPTKVPTVLVISPYTMQGKVTNGYLLIRRLLVERGYAFASMHTRGTGSSGGCNVLGGPEEAHDGAAVIEYLGRDAEWANGVVGAFGLSYSAMAELAAATGGPAAQTQYLKALAIGAPNASWYDYINHDGVPSTGGGPVIPSLYAVGSYVPYYGPADLLSGDPRDAELVAMARLAPGGVPAEHAAERAACQPENFAGMNDNSGDVSDWYAARDWRVGIEKLTVPTFLYHGYQDVNVPIHVESGLFDRITAPKAGLFGEFPHAWLAETERPPSTLFASDEPEVHREYRPDHWRMVVAWFDQYLRGIDSGATRWPVAQVQGSDGRWRAEPNWPATGGPVGQLALSAGRLGGEPAGAASSSYREVPWLVDDIDDGTRLKPDASYVAFDSGPLPDRLEITGMPVLDVWLQLDSKDAHIGAELRTYDADGKPLERTDELGYAHSGATSGFRSMRHLDAFDHARFAQHDGHAVTAGDTIHTLLRFKPTDLVVPKGGRIVLTIGGSERWSSFMPPVYEPGRPSGANANVTILHDCAHPTALRFLMAAPTAERLDVELPEKMHAPEPVTRESIVSDGGGVATARVCGEKPSRVPEIFDAVG